MTLEESIRFHAEEAEKMKLHKKVNEIILGSEGYERALQEHTQTAEWLKELAERRKQPERKTGHFIGTEFDGYADGSPVYYEWKCSECGCVFEDDEPTYNYCPNCGADMREERDGD